jgi:alginate O-acetyltransferase complex protein AlgI
MTFTSWPFVIFFFALMAALAAARSRTQRQAIILVASLAFYGYWNRYYLLLLATPSIIDFYCSRAIAASSSQSVRRAWLVASLASNLGLLAYFKYTDFLVSNIAAILGRDFAPLHVLLPVGISFYTFKTLSYTIDVYRREIPVCYDWWRYAMFVTYFPDLIAGPIVRASIFLPQMTRSLKPSWTRTGTGIQMVMLGFAKKLLIADRLAILPDAVFGHPALFDSFTVVCAVVAYSLQIYCDFSGYSDIAIGISKIIGLDLPENFNMPYSATSITDFWRRWHMTLSAWLRDYLYIPLGGNRKGRIRTFINLFLTMFLGGLWHGANWTFVLWGCLHAFALAVHKLWNNKDCRSREIPPVLAWLITYGFVCVAWVFFRSPNFSTAYLILRKLAFIDRVGISYGYFPLAPILLLVVLAHLLGKQVESIARSSSIPSTEVWWQRVFIGMIPRIIHRPKPISGYYFTFRQPGFVSGFVLTICFLILYLFAASNSNPFIYFQF